MGDGEQYWDKFWAWYMALPVEGRVRFRVLYPEPGGLGPDHDWSGIYSLLEKHW